MMLENPYGIYFRDCMMNIDGHGYQKVTHAHAFGGPELAVDTLNKNLT